MDTIGELKKSRTEIQQEMIDSAVESINETGNAAWIASVGIGKSYSALQVIAKYNPPKITWLTSSEELRDIDSQQEFFKWDFAYLHERCTFMCYQTACKLENYDFGFLVCDEFDAAITDVYLKSVTNNNFNQGLFVTGTITEEKRDVLKQIGINISYEITTNIAQSLGILNSTNIVFVEYDLYTEKNRLVETKTSKWFTSENEQYLYWENQYMSNLIKYLAVKKTIDDHYSGKQVVQNFSYEQQKRVRTGFAVKMKYAAGQRAKILHTLDSSKKVARQISDRLLSDSKNKVILFSSLTEHLDSYVPYTVHSKNKKGNSVLDDFNKGLIRELGVISMIDRGKNMVGLNNAIFESYDGSETKGTQRLGRLARLMADDVATLYVLVPYYRNKQNKRLPTRAAGWSLSMFSNYQLDESNSKTINIKDLIL